MDITLPDIISHVRRDDSGRAVGFQSNTEHSQGVAGRARSFASEFGMGGWGYALGMLHDKGKEKRQFQAYIRAANGMPAGVNYTQEGKAHAYVGAILAKSIYGAQALQLFCNQIAAHHRGLYDYDELEEIIRRPLPEEIDGAEERYKLDAPPFRPGKEEFHHLSRMLFSCLVDADYLDTEAFMNEENARARGCRTSLASLLPVLERYIERLQHGAKKSVVNEIRNEVQVRCRELSDRPKGFFSLTVPTGGGKTLSSLLWAMRHAVRNGMKRIIIAIPYTSIIVQTASILKKIFGEVNVLEHHSNFNSSEVKDARLRHKIKLATENWDYPIIVTTNVQLFESMFSNRPSDCRKLHNIVNSVIILDEVQTLPSEFLQPIVDALKAYHGMFGVSALFTTASQPILSGIIEGCNPGASFVGIDRITEIIPEEYALHDRLRRVDLEIDKESCTYDEIAVRLSRHDRVLCIVNTRNDAREIYRRLPQDGLTIHLSRMMCPRHISLAIEKIKKALDDDNAGPVRVVATQLIEAGVDIDFPVVFRQEAGLDSVLQAAGRCNREGKSESATTYVFSFSDGNRLYGSIKDANEARLNMKPVADWFAPEAMTEYFRQLYCRKDSFDSKGMKSLLYKPSEMCFERASKDFRLIEDSGKSVVVNYENSQTLIEQLKRDGVSYPLMKRIAQYTVNIHERDFRKLLSYGAIEEAVEGTEIYVVTDKAQYDAGIGLRLDNHWMNEILMV